MALPNELHPLQLGAGSASGYQIEQSLRFDGSSYMTRTPASNGSLSTWTYSTWIKYGDVAGSIVNTLISTKATVTPYGQLLIRADQELGFYQRNSGNTDSSWQKYSSNKLRDPSAWYHFLFVLNTGDSTVNNRQRMWINGVEVTSFSSDYKPGSADNSAINSTQEHMIGAYRSSSIAGYMKGYMAETHFVDGTALDPTDFGEYDNSGVWRPIEYTGSYGTNGFYLKFDPSAANGIGHDHSGNGNNFTASGFVTSGTGTDVMSDTPTKNWCTLNPLDKVSGLTISDGNLRCVSTASDRHVRSTFFLPTSGKWYWEMTATTVNTAGYLATGLYHSTGSLTATAIATAQGRWYSASGNGNGGGWGDTYDDGDIVSIAVDMDNGTIFAAKNGVWQASGNPVTGANPMYNDLLTAYSPDGWSPVCANWQSGNTADFNFGQREFAYPPGTSSATDYFNTVTYTGNNGTQTITGVGFQPDFVWIKRYNTNGQDHVLQDSVRGFGSSTKLASSSTSAESVVNNGATDPIWGYITAATSDGFSITASTSGDQVNHTSGNYVAWCWNAGDGNPVTRTDDGGGDSSDYGNMQTTTVKSSPDSGLAIATWTSDGSKDFIAHDLGAQPDLVIVKRTDDTGDWYVYDRYSSGRSYYSKLNSTAARVLSTNFWGNSTRLPTATKFPITGLVTGTNGQDFVAYLFRSVEGTVKSHYYQGNGSSDGPFIETGFSPSMILIKRTYGGTGGWIMLDKARDSTNPNDTRIEAQSSYGNYTIGGVDFQSNGFKLRTNNAEWNASGSEYIYIAFAENFTADDSYKSLNTANLPAPTVKDGSKYFNPVIYAPDGSSSFAVTGVGFQPDLVWVKSRVYAEDHQLNDAVRGATKGLQSNLTNAETTQTNGLTSFDSDGFTVGNLSDYNYNGDSIISWNWLAGGSGSSNTDGTITSTISANPTAGFSIVSYTASGTDNDTVGHGLGVAPSFYIVKSRDGARDWLVYTREIDGSLDFLRLNTNAAAANSSANAPTSTVFSIYGADINTAGEDCIAYCFAEVEGYSKMSSWTGNGSSDGVFLYCGFRPAWIMYKITNTTGNWIIHDTTRSEYNVTTNRLFANLTNAEGTSATVSWDLLSNGAKIRTSDAGVNGSGNTFIFAAFAENPFGGTGVSPTTAR